MIGIVVVVIVVVIVVIVAAAVVDGNLPFLLYDRFIEVRIHRSQSQAAFVGK